MPWRPRANRWLSHADPVATPRQLSSAAARQRRYAERQRDGRLIVPLEVDADDLRVLIQAQVLDPRADVFTREAIATAISNYLKISADA
jgi:hypothetical protein